MTPRKWSFLSSIKWEKPTYFTWWTGYSMPNSGMKEIEYKMQGKMIWKKLKCFVWFWSFYLDLNTYCNFERYKENKTWTQIVTLPQEGNVVRFMDVSYLVVILLYLTNHFVIADLHIVYEPTRTHCYSRWLSLPP